MTSYRIALLAGAVLFGMAGSARAAGETDLVRDLAGRVGPVIGSALACPEIARPRVQSIVEKFASVIREASANEAERSDLAQLFDRSVADGRATVMSGRMDCQQADRRLADLEQSLQPVGSSVQFPAAAARPRHPHRCRRYANRCPGRNAARRHRPRNPVRNHGGLYRSGKGTGPPDETRHRDGFQPGQRRRRCGRANAPDHRRRRRQRADADPRSRQAALREGPGLRHHRQHRHGDRGRRGPLFARAADAVLRCLHRRQCRAPRSARSLRVQLSSELCSRKPTPRCVIW